MEEKGYLFRFGKKVKEIRKKKHMSQVKFHQYLFPEDGRNPEAIIKRMNAIENCKYQSLDLEFLLVFCRKCDVSCDFVLGLSNDYSNHEIEFVSNYTGLEEKAVTQLHKWNVDKNNGADVSKIDEAFCGENEEDIDKQYKMMRDKQIGQQFLRIINYLFTEGIRRNPERRGKKEPYTNLTILYSLYMLTMVRPEIIKAHLSNESLEENSWLFDPHITDLTDYSITVDAHKMMMLQDSSKIWYPCSAQQIIDLYARNKLNKSIDQLIEQIRNEKQT